MSFLSTRRHRIAAAVTAVAITAGGGAAVIVAATAPASAGTITPVAALSAATAPATTHAGRAAKHHHRSLLARTDHATLELKAKGKWVTVDLDRGKVTAVSATAISLARPDGQSVTLAIDSATKFGHKAAVSALKTGVEATVTSENGTARRVVEALHPKAAAAPSTAATPA